MGWCSRAGGTPPTAASRPWCRRSSGARGRLRNARGWKVWHHDVTLWQFNQMAPALDAADTEAQFPGDLPGRSIGVVQSPDPVEHGLTAGVTASPRLLLLFRFRGPARVTGTGGCLSRTRHRRMPIFRTWTIPLITSRLRRGLTPRRCIGTAALIDANCSSVSQNRFDIDSLPHRGASNPVDRSQVKRKLGLEPGDGDYQQIVHAGEHGVRSRRVIPKRRGETERSDEAGALKHRHSVYR
jgi:hypothetical protein